jgi:DNA polymerase-3 subunit alpha
MAAESGETEGEVHDSELPDVDMWPTSEMLAYEKDLLGFYISGHPLEEFEWELKVYATHPTGPVEGLEEGTAVRMGGLVTNWRRFFTKNEKEMATFDLEGNSGSLPAVMFSESLQRCGTVLHDELPVMVAGEYGLRDGSPQLVVQEVCPLSRTPDWYADMARVHLTEAQVEEGRLRELRQELDEFRGETPLHFCVTFPEGQRVFLQSDGEFNVHPSHSFIQRVEHLFGEDCVYVQPREDVYKTPPPKREFGQRQPA